YGRALKKFNTIEKFFYDIYDDQFDFHTYSIRKATMRTYIDLVRMEDRLRAHPFYFRAAVEAVKWHVFAFDKKITDEKQKTDEMSQMSESERKKALRKAKKAELAKGDSKDDVTKSSGSLVASANANTKDGKKKDDDPDGSKLLSEGDLLTQSLKFLKPLLELSPGRIESQILGVSVYLRRKNYLLAAKALKNGYKIDPSNPELHKLAVELATAVNADSAINEKVKPIVLEGLQSVLQGQDLKAFNESFGKKHSTDSILHAASFAETSAIVGGDVSAAVDIVVSVSSREGVKKMFNVEVRI
ncbi:UNVERIFIED_CONTAM: hypothetical protein HDU68_012496, partial [Siphonaria sp. JEL0065]